MYDDFVKYMREFLTLCKDELDIKQLPKIEWITSGNLEGTQPSFGMFRSKDKIIRVEIGHRHLLDSCRTLAHELAHYKQSIKGEITFKSGETGSKQENEANAEAGVIMRKFNKAHPDAFKTIPIGCKSLIGKAIDN